MQYPDAYLRPCVSAGECDKMFKFLLEVGVHHHKTMCLCEFKNSFPLFFADSIIMITGTITCKEHNLAGTPVQVSSK